MKSAFGVMLTATKKKRMPAGATLLWAQAAGTGGGTLWAIDCREVDHRAHEACVELIPEINSQEEEADLAQDKLRLASALSHSGERFTPRVR